MFQKTMIHDCYGLRLFSQIELQCQVWLSFENQLIKLDNN